MRWIRSFLVLLVAMATVCFAASAEAANVPNACYTGLVESVVSSDYDYDAEVCVLVGSPVPSTSYYDYFNLGVTCSNVMTYLYDRGTTASYFYENDSDGDPCVSGSVYLNYLGAGCVYYAWHWPSGVLDGDGILCD